ncbi:progranulin-like isoform X2 [Xenia sp. Carnegie-2017]|uniref:progranulin-like isoform X2 n=2 Tax=Xenia sp. Carnegie-2017 TaxID=2897299 RepID=UPI001F04CEC8|nr:progranulin-like isoform X2 [Xenia sp. Carnegie-2017]
METIWIFAVALIFNQIMFIECFVGNSTSKVHTVKCGPLRCPDGQMCCSDVGSRSYGCCFLKDGICCTNPIGCCPKGYVCKGRYCHKPGNVMQLFEKQQNEIEVKKSLQIP